jgi:hypothetical protein
MRIEEEFSLKIHFKWRGEKLLLYLSGSFSP